MTDGPLSSENRASIVSRAKGIIAEPKLEWAKIALETKTPKEVLLQYALPLMLIGPICSIIGNLISPYSLGLTYSIASAVVGFLLSIGLLYGLAFAANFLSSQFGGNDNFAAAFRLVAYSWTPVWLIGVLGLVFGIAPILALLVYAALAYGFYIFYLGATPLLAVPQDKAVGYTALYVVAGIVLYLIIGAITASIVFSVVPAPAIVIYS